MACEITRPKLDQILDDKDPGENLWGNYLTPEELQLRACLTCKMTMELLRDIRHNERMGVNWLMNLITTAITWGMIAQKEGGDGDL